MKVEVMRKAGIQTILFFSSTLCVSNKFNGISLSNLVYFITLKLEYLRPVEGAYFASIK